MTTDTTNLVMNLIDSEKKEEETPKPCKITTKKILIGAGVLGLVGAAAYYFYQKKKQ